MTTLIAICGQPLVHALGWTLLHLCWQGAGIAVVLWCVLGVLSGRGSRARYAASCLALGLMVVVPLATFAHLASDEYRQRAAYEGPAVAIDAGMVLRVEAGETSAPLPERMVVALDHALPWVLVAWFAGVIIFVGRLNVGLLVARRMRLVATTAISAELQQVFDALRRRLGVGRAVRLMHSALVEVPTVIGWLRPVVLVPASCLSGLSTMQIEAILAHELAHIRRHDYLVSVLQSVIETLLFYHPAVWWVSKQVRRERECCCDEMAVAVGGDRLAYARALSVLEERRSYSPEFVLGANGGVLTMRIKRLLGCKEDSAVSQMAAFAVLALIVALAGSYVVTAARAEVSALRRAARVASPMELDAVTPLNALIAEPAVREFRLKGPVLMAQAEAPAAPPAAAAPVAGMLDGAPPAVPAALGGPVRVSSGTLAGMILSKTNPVYPAEAKAAHVQGAVILHAIISKTGTVENLHVISGNAMLVNSAIDAVQQWTYKPYLLNGQPVEVETSITVNYTLADSTTAMGPMPPADEAGNGVKQIGGGVTGPKIIYEPWPDYTELARKDKVEGVVLVSLVVDEHGLAQHVKLLRGLGDGLDEKAVEAVKKYVFKPGTENDKPVAVYVNVEMKFQLAASPAQSQGQSLAVTVTDDGVRQIEGDVKGPVILYQPEPVYTQAGRKAKVQGVVTVSIVVDEHGQPQNVHIVRSLGIGPDGRPDPKLKKAARVAVDGMNQSAVEAVKQYKFKPATENGKPVAVYLNVEVNFEIF